MWEEGEGSWGRRRRRLTCSRGGGPGGGGEKKFLNRFELDGIKTKV